MAEIREWIGGSVSGGGRWKRLMWRPDDVDEFSEAD